MRKRLVCFLTIVLASATLGAGPAEAQVGARIWLEEEPDYFRRGDRMNVSFSVSDDAYVAVVHVDTDGNLDFVYPASPWDNEFVRGGRIHSLPTRGGSSWTVRGRAGIGYFYLIVSPDPLDFSYFRGRGSMPWDWGYAGRVISGDPFVAFDQLSRMLLPRWPYAPYAFDYYSDYVGGVHRYPTYACSDRYLDYGWGWTPSYGACGRLDYFLRDHPYYYDTRLYRGDRRGFLREYDRLDPRHGFKEDPDQPARGITPGSSRIVPQPSPDPIPRREPVPPAAAPDRRDAGAAQPAGRGSAAPTGARGTTRDRPSPEIGSGRPSDSGSTTPTSRRPARGRP
ncbi:MAG TPA: DUF4384 domain-containing protein [Longimicrobiaceae bacterium]|nr:DUF4384 domain-containing protein [Longimicrobiaceae bacterium]